MSLFCHNRSIILLIIHACQLFMFCQHLKFCPEGSKFAIVNKSEILLLTSYSKTLTFKNIIIQIIKFTLSESIIGINSDKI